MKQILSRKIRHRRVRARIKGTKERPRLSVFRSNKHIHIQLINDDLGVTFFSVSDVLKDKKKTVKGKSELEKRIESAERAGEKVAKQAKKLDITKVVFDRGGYRYHGLVRAVAEGARKGGLIF